MEAKLDSDAPVRGRARRERLMDAAIEVLGERPLEEISLADISARAQIPVGSAYHFYPNVNAVFAALAQRFAEELDALLAQPYVGPDAQSWQSILRAAIDRAAKLYNERPDYRQLILGGKTPADIKLADRANDERIGQILIRAIEQQFVLPDFPHRGDVFFFVVELADVLFMLSHMRHGTITTFMREEASRAGLGYLRTYLPEYLPRRSAAGDAVESHAKPERTP